MDEKKYVSIIEACGEKLHIKDAEARASIQTISEAIDDSRSVEYDDVIYKSYGNIAGSTQHTLSYDYTENGPVFVQTIQSDITGVTVSNIPVGHSFHLLITVPSGQNDCGVAISNGANCGDGNSIKCPNGEDLQITVPSGGYVDVDFLKFGTNYFVRLM